MFTKGELFTILAETPVHYGSGSAIGVVDLPIQREAYTELPVIHGQGLKGAIRDFFEQKENGNYKKVEIIFGPENTDYSSCIGFSQASLLLFPIPSFKGVFAYATSFYCINKFLKDFRFLYGNKELENFDLTEKNKLPTDIDEDIAYTPESINILLDNKVILTNSMFKANKAPIATKIANFLSEKLIKSENYNMTKELIKKNLVILNNTVFSKFTKMKTEVVYRNKIGKNGIVEEGALWTEEYLPSDTIMWSVLFVGKPYNKTEGIDLKNEDDVINYIKNNLYSLFIGGNKTIGKGLISIHFWR